ncbi:hypothetical protein RF11_14991 [Thelohanellus kitauei]|uniref:Uncharacterized protein n=1 Tax=Thelohanellus kitauei TaxID=669202 RepID=A0A0C2IEN8_THEKT|nr:hypothetical protein RF11_14991 [Thelohanellus kitauei]
MLFSFYVDFTILFNKCKKYSLEFCTNTGLVHRRFCTAQNARNFSSANECYFVVVAHCESCTTQICCRRVPTRSGTLSHVNNVANAVDVKYVQLCTCASFYNSMTVLKNWS